MVVGSSWRTEQNCISSSRGRLNFLGCHRKYILCWSLMRMNFVLFSLLKSWEMVERGRVGECLLMFTVISTVFSVFSSRWFWLHHNTSRASCQSVSSLINILKVADYSYIICKLHTLVICLEGEKVPVLVCYLLEVIVPILTSSCCALLLRKLVIHCQVEGVTE